MRFKVKDNKVTFKCGALNASDDNLTCIDIKQWYENLGGKIDPMEKSCKRVCVLFQEAVSTNQARILEEKPNSISAQ